MTDNATVRTWSTEPADYTPVIAHTQHHDGVFMPAPDGTIVQIDTDLVPVVAALWNAGHHTSYSCIGGPRQNPKSCEDRDMILGGYIVISADTARQASARAHLLAQISGADLDDQTRPRRLSWLPWRRATPVNYAFCVIADPDGPLGKPGPCTTLYWHHDNTDRALATLHRFSQENP